MPVEVFVNKGSCIPYFSSYRALVTKAKLKPGDKVLIHGASGAVGIACLQIARSLGAHVLGTAGTQEGLELALKNGAYNAFNHRNTGYINKIKKAAGGSVDIIIEMLANVNLQTDIDIISIGGRIVIFDEHRANHPKESYPMRRAAQWTAYLFLRGKAIGEEKFERLKDSDTSGKVKSFGKTFVKEVQEGFKDLNKQSKNSK